MMFFAVDDEPRMLRTLHEILADAAPDAEIRDFSKASRVLSAVEEEGLHPDVVFSDIEMPGMDGLELAVRIKTASPETKLIFVTAFPKYAADAFRLHANGYIVKPIQAERVREELALLDLTDSTPPYTDKLRVQCFGYFDVFWQDSPLVFQWTQTKELLAYLIDREGAACTSGEIALALWEGEIDSTAAKNRIRVLLNDLRTALRAIGMEDVLIRQRRQLAIDRSNVDCDYYRMLDGDISMINAYRGEYMKQYSWAELTTAKLHFRK
ncbi:MAG: response regulator [Firmicutes bacterium]|nr:response regulator [Bacillota bacterium]